MARTLQRPVGEVHDPVVGDPGPGVEARLLPLVGREAPLGHLDHQCRRGGILCRVVPRTARHDREVGFGLGLLRV